MEKRREYSKPFLMVEKFVPQNYCYVCDAPRDMLWSPVDEDNGIPGWQSSDTGLPSGSHIDNKDKNPISLYLGCTGFTWRIVKAEDNTYDQDNHNTYWEIKLTGPASLFKKSGNLFTEVDGSPTYAAGAIFYKNYDAVNGLISQARNNS